jgi:uncharacterized membrane protein YciS (DUF1049 family)
MPGCCRPLANQIWTIQCKDSLGHSSTNLYQARKVFANVDDSMMYVEWKLSQMRLSQRMKRHETNAAALVS